MGHPGRAGFHHHRCTTQCVECSASSGLVLAKAMGHHSHTALPQHGETMDFIPKHAAHRHVVFPDQIGQVRRCLSVVMIGVQFTGRRLQDRQVCFPGNTKPLVMGQKLTQ